MPAGDLVVANYQYEFNGLLFGAGTSFVTTKVTGLLGMPNSTSDDTDKELGHGAIPGFIRMGKRFIGIDLHVLGTPITGVEANLRLARQAFKAPALYRSRILQPFVFQRPGEVKQFLNVRCDKRDFDSNYDLAMGRASGSVQLVAPDPVIYSMIQKTFSITLASAATALSDTLNMLGDHADGVDCLLKITGPARNPRIQRSSTITDNTFIFAIDLDIEAGEYLLVDTGLRTAQVFSVATDDFLREAFGNIRLDSDWFTLIPGANLMTYSRQAGALTGSASTATLTWRDGWS